MKKFFDDSVFTELLKSYGRPVRVSADQAMVLALVEMEGPNAFCYERHKKGAALTPNNPAAFGVANIRDVYVFIDRSKKKTRHIVVVEGVGMDGKEADSPPEENADRPVGKTGPAEKGGRPGRETGSAFGIRTACVTRMTGSVVSLLSRMVRRPFSCSSFSTGSAF